jgi:hypothetical protein
MQPSAESMGDFCAGNVSARCLDLRHVTSKINVETSVTR